MIKRTFAFGFRTKSSSDVDETAAALAEEATVEGGRGGDTTLPPPLSVTTKIERFLLLLHILPYSLMQKPRGFIYLCCHRDGAADTTDLLLDEKPLMTASTLVSTLARAGIYYVQVTTSAHTAATCMPPHT